ncbi:MAG: T9SS type A sorting domain-containing protein [Bacteroidetes bacterium]|nr:T9SS type A sorting domain-containing protein [Bacteroidota bacterium]
MTGEQVLPKIAVCSNGDLYVAWFSNESGNYNVRLQLLDKNGNELWAPNGILVSNHEQMSWLTDWDMTVDTANFAVLTFQDIRTGENNPVAYCISPEGEMMWGSDGISLSNNANFEPSPKVCATDAGNSVFAWQSEASGGSEIHLQKISDDGQPQWGDGIVLSSPSLAYTYPYLRTATNDQVFLIWHKQSGPAWAPNRGLYVQLLDADGNAVWDNELEIYAPVASGAVITLQLASDYNGGIIFAWYYNDVGTHFNCKVQHMDASGNLSLPANGVLVSTFMNRNHMYPAPAFLPETQEIVVYFSEQDLNQNQRGLYAQKLDMDGNRLWTDQGKQLIALSNNDYSLPVASGLDDKAICIYQSTESMSGSNAKIQAVMLDTDGNFVWDDEFIDMSTYQSSKLHLVMTDYYYGQWVTVWEDERNGGRDIYAQNIQKDGTLGEVITSVNIPIESKSLIEVKVSPTPFEKMVSISIASSECGEVYFEIFNTGGQLIHSSVHSKSLEQVQFSWDAEGLPAGIYFYTLQLLNDKKSGKLIKR